jgi:2-keto-4-pentenoate hydratase
MSDEKAARHLVNAIRPHGISAIGSAVKLLVNAHRTRELAATADVALQSEEDAYRVQDSVYSRLWAGTRPVAWKVGGPSDKVEPTAAPIPPEHLLRSPATVAASSLHMLGVEAEVAFRLAKDLPPRSKAYKEKDILAAVGEVVVAIEICDSRLADWKTASGLWKLADFQTNSALIAGSGTAEWQKIDFAKQEVEFAIGARISRAKGVHPFGNPVRLLPWLVKHCAKRGMGLHAGDVVTTGAWTGLEIAQPGDEVVAKFPGIGEAKLKIT